MWQLWTKDPLRQIFEILAEMFALDWRRIYSQQIGTSLAQYEKVDHFRKCVPLCQKLKAGQEIFASEFLK